MKNVKRPTQGATVNLEASNHDQPKVWTDPVLRLIYTTAGALSATRGSPIDRRVFTVPIPIATPIPLEFLRDDNRSGRGCYCRKVAKNRNEHPPAENNYKVFGMRNYFDDRVVWMHELWLVTFLSNHTLYFE